MEDIKDKVILVTGGGRGLGEAISRCLAKSGANVQVADIRVDLAENVVSDIRKAGGRATAVRLDVTDSNQIDRVVLNTVSQYGRLDAVVNNAGVDKTVSVEELSIDEWNKILAVNLTAPFMMSRRVMPVLREQGGGHIINIVSTAARRAWPNAAAYHASKWGLLGFTHALHTEGRAHGVKVTAFITGGMRTPFLLDRFPEIDIETLQEPADVAESVKYVLCAPRGSVIPEIMSLPMRETSWP